MRFARLTPRPVVAAIGSGFGVIGDTPGPCVGGSMGSVPIGLYALGDANRRMLSSAI